MTKENIDDLILQRLGGWKEKDGSLPQFVGFYEQLLRLQIEVKSGIAEPRTALLRESAAGRLRQGLPLMKFDDLSLDWSVVQSHLLAVTDILACYVAEGVGSMKGLRELASDIPQLQQVAIDWYDEESLSSTSAKVGVSEMFLSAVLQTVLRPFLLAHSNVLHKLVDQNLWRHGNCPICGGKPDFAFLDKEQGERWLLCSRCEAEWLFQRLECPYCGTRDSDKLSYRTDDRELYRLYMCDGCRSYIKAFDMRKAEGKVLLQLERILTLDLDKQAVRAGYQSG